MSSDTQRCFRKEELDECVDWLQLFVDALKIDDDMALENIHRVSTGVGPIS